ncbi:MAG: BMP family ABC transporter substrate-binding protein [Chloroflexi bacterium]|nr:MAG: BMP family ABC transporter substrate-binding protein [Chloroflexota bacterium]
MKKLSALLLLVLIAGILVACAPKATPTPEPPVAETTAEPVAEPEEQLRVAVIFNTTIKDGGYAQAGYESLMAMKDKYNLDVSYQESVGDANVKDVLRSYAADGYDLVYAHELYFTDAVNEVAAEFPDVKFGVTGYKADFPNVVALDATNWQGVYLDGVVAGLMTKNNKIAMVTVSQSPTAFRMVNAMYMGAKLYNPDVEIIHLFTGSFDDVVKAKEMATAAIKDGADIVYGNCGMGTTGVIEAAKENNTLAIGSVVDRSPLAPELVLTSNILDSGRYLTLAVEGMINGDLEWGKAYILGVKEGVEFLAPFNEIVSQDIIDKVEQATQDLVDGKVELPANDNYLWLK